MLFAAPLVIIAFWLMPTLEQKWINEIMMFNFVGDLGLGFTGGTNDTNLAIRGIYLFRLMFYSLVIPCFSLIGVGMSGLFYSSRNVAWGGKIKFRHFFRGVKKYWLPYTIAFTIIGIVAYAVLASIFGYLYLVAAGLTSWYMWFVMIIACLIALAIIYFMLQYLPMVTMYDFSNKDKIKNSVLLSVALLIQATFLTILLVAIPLALVWTSITQMLLLVTFALFGFAAYTTAIQCFGVHVADNYTSVLYQNKLYAEEKERRRAATESKRNSNKNKKKKGNR